MPRFSFREGACEMSATSKEGSSSCRKTTCSTTGVSAGWDKFLLSAWNTSCPPSALTWVSEELFLLHFLTLLILLLMHSIFFFFLNLLSQRYSQHRSWQVLLDKLDLILVWKGSYWALLTEDTPAANNTATKIWYHCQSSSSHDDILKFQIFQEET